jgi:hypothetical protein
MKLIAFMSSYTNQGTYWLQGHENSISLSRQASVNKTEQEKSRQRSYSVQITKISPVKNCILKKVGNAPIQYASQKFRL